MKLESVNKLGEDGKHVDLHGIATDEMHPGIKEYFLFETRLLDGPAADALIEVTKEEFEKRYTANDLESYFFHPYTFIRIVSAAFNQKHPEYPSNPITKGMRNRVYDNETAAPYHPLNAEIDVYKRPNEPVMINVEYWFEEGPKNVTKNLQINPPGVQWDHTTSRFINHPDASDLNHAIEEEVEVIKEGVRDYIRSYDPDNKDYENNSLVWD